MQRKQGPVFCILLVSFGLLVSCKSREREEKKPEGNRFTTAVMAKDLDEPMEFKFLGDGRILFVERKGKIKVLDPATGAVQVIADIPVSNGYYSLTGEMLESTGEDGMEGIAVDPDFDQNHWIYLYYSPKGGEPKSILTRYEWPEGGVLNIDSKKVLLEIPNQRESCCHLGGGMVFDKNKNLLLSTGDNTPNDPRGYSPLDGRPGRSRYDSRRSAGNSNDLRGKILRIHPKPDGTYSIPAGNLFPKGTPKTRPEIYTMGNRNPWRLSIDSRSGWLYWGEVGPSGTHDSAGMGPRSYDEFNQAKKAGNFGWPLFLADNKPYWEYDYATGQQGIKFDPDQPVNHSPNNTGLENLPPAQPAFIWYPQSEAIDFPLLGSGSNSAVGGPVYHRSDFRKPARPFPAYYEGKWFITDWVRGWIMAVSMDDDGKFRSMEQFLPELKLEGPIDMHFGPDGDLYVLEYGRGTYKRNREARLVRIEYNGGNRAPVVNVSANRLSGAVPLRVNLSSAGTKDYDDDSLSYEWNVVAQGKVPQHFTGTNPAVTLLEGGIYQVTLTVTDSRGAKNTNGLTIIAGNEPPLVAFDFHGGNRSFFFPDQKITYSVLVSDKEDGELSEKEMNSSAHKINPAAVSVSIDYLAAGNDFKAIAHTLRENNSPIPVSAILAGRLIGNSNCVSCHSMNTKQIGPSYLAIAEKYRSDQAAADRLAKKIISGGTGVWGEEAMPAHPELLPEDVQTIVQYILNLAHPETADSFPADGSYTTKVAAGKDDRGRFVFRASYTDKGTESAPKQSASAVVFLRNPVIPVSQADQFNGLVLNHQIDPFYTSVTPKKQTAYLGLKQIDLTGINCIAITARAISDPASLASAKIEIRMDAPGGQLIGAVSSSSIWEKAGKRSFSQAKAYIDKVDGLHNIYFVFGDESAGKSISQMKIRAVQFMHR